MIRSVALSFVLAAMIAVSANAQEKNAPTGAIRICRHAHSVGSQDRASVPIPAGAVFLASTPDEARQAILVRTLRAVTIGPRPHCVRAPAVLEFNRSGRPLAAGVRLPLTQLTIPGLDLEAIVVRAFKSPAVVPDTRLINGGSYVNSAGNIVHSPSRTVSGAPPPGATAECRDGTYSFSQHRRGTCSHHGGVANWVD